MKKEPSSSRALIEKGITAPFHSVPLHSAHAGNAFGQFNGDDVHTTRESSLLVRLPLWYGIRREDRKIVINLIVVF